MQTVIDTLRAGTATWGGLEVGFAIRKVVRSWPSARGAETRSLTTYEFHVSGVATHQFSTLEEAERYATDSLRDRAEHEPIGRKVTQSSLFASWVGQTVVEALVDDIERLRFFDGSRVSFAVELVVVLGRDAVQAGDDDYWRAIATLSGAMLTATEDYWDVGIVLGFDRASVIIAAAAIRTAPTQELILVDNRPILTPDDAPWSSKPRLYGGWSLRLGAYDDPEP